ncbi:MAG TPA: hypothetical protein VFQ61_29445 [Polyangiaceae bacterium]|nr:hypothetical protein [Polyangiaceae bacterium]
MAGVIRPSFELESPLDADTIVELVHRRLVDRESPICGVTAAERIELHVPSSRQHLWSPQLVIDLHEEEEGRTAVYGRFGPHPHVWVLYVGVLAAAAFACLVGGSFGVAQLAMEETPTALWSLPAAAAVVVVLYLMAVAGRSLSAEQMSELRSFFEGALQDRPVQV